VFHEDRSVGGRELDLILSPGAGAPRPHSPDSTAGASRWNREVEGPAQLLAHDPEGQEAGRQENSRMMRGRGTATPPGRAAGQLFGQHDTLPSCRAARISTTPAGFACL